ncbi:MAG: type III pantothenate kinase, partial [Actinomycetota bacterium]|nr:type III pantothenate kinase [Actinomycetota bacterium]
MILAVDVGNTQTVLGLFTGRELSSHWRVATDPTLTADELRVKIGGLLGLDGLGWPDIERIVLSSVVPALTAHYEEMSVRATGTSPLTVGPGIKTGMPIKYDNPHEVGADRIVNGIAAFEAFGGPIIIIDFGTATTLDVVDGTGAYLGGA